MIEPVMYFGIGFLIAALLGLLFLPLVHNRAVRLTQRRLEAATPLSVSEIRADKDQLRAEFAMSTRRLEISVEQMRSKTTTQLAELGKKAEAINQLRKELADKTATIVDLETRDRTLREQLQTTEREVELRSTALHTAERTLAAREAELVKLLDDVGQHSTLADSQRIELASLRTQVDAMKLSVSEYERTVSEAEQRRERERDASMLAAAELADARVRLESLTMRTQELEQQLAEQAGETEVLNQRVRELEMQLESQNRGLLERNQLVAQLRAELDKSRTMAADLGAELANASRGSSAADKLRTEVAQLEAQLAASFKERASLQNDIATLQRDAESTWAAERVENALLRERINDVAAEVARLTTLLEGSESPIHAMLAADEDHYSQSRATMDQGSRGTVGANDIAGRNGTNTLADRIRALQATASRVTPAN